ncbi:SusC/RagA family TonB-linked outer membrane protein [Flavivirga amylovorans]|uniref:SusC/RagA family TonB-linked outer membrane protein n=1 Tax=Flavivirga amylovorans TaxID=870486 RepID=A0ABT8X3Z2_9FLAO|nr:SusC/RagA family TonB-linked outer membrane protein [Flavivirga amylovorans]MDO5988432.1 SusC/RagA family TonB-linked outer membrane protein [Flavivirga amylovorans]
MKKKFSGLLTLLLAFVVQLSFAQEKTISGTISDVSGLPLPGATVLIKGTTSGTSSDFDGKYSIRASQGAVLVFSFVGYTSTEVTVNASNTINMTLQEDATALEEVVVTAFGIKRNAKNLGYAVSQVESKEVIENSEPDLLRSLSGKVAGVNVNFSNGVAGASNQISIRGQTTIGGASQPLFIVDGIAYDNRQVSTVELQPPSGFSTGGGGYESGISSLDPNNIETVTVLKSTAAAALYGSRATNGVIVITTKSGSSLNKDANNKLSVSVSSGTYFEKIANLPDYQNKYGQGTQFKFNAGSNGSWGPAFDTLETIPVWNSWVTAFPDVYGPGLIETLPYEAQPNNVEDLFDTGVVLDNSVTASSSNENGSFSVTLSDLQQKGYMPFNTYERTSFSAGGNFKLPNNITVGGSVSYSDTDQVGGFFGNQQFAGSSSSFARSLWLGRAWDLSIPYTNPITGGSVIPNTGWDHPLWSWENDQITTNTNRVVTNLSIGVPINEHISASFRVGYNKYNLNRREVRHPASIASALTGGTLITDGAVNEDLESTLLLNFNYDLTDDIGFSAIAGLNTYQNTFKRDANLGTTFISPNIYTLANTITTSSLEDSYARKRNVGVFADLTLSYKDFLFLNGTGRNDWSSTLPLDNRSYFYPSASLSLIVTEALKLDSNTLTFAKLRGGWASVGNDAAAEFLNTTFALGVPFAAIPVVGNRVGLGDQEITPEFTDEIEIGADLEFFKRRIAIDFTWYKKTTTDLISPVSVPRSSGFTSFNTNIGEMTNTGIEIGLTLLPIQTENFTWNLFTTFTKNKNEVTELVEGLERIRLDGNQIAYAIKGEPFGVFFGSKHLRDEEGNYIIDQSTGWIFQDPTSDVIGDPTPDFKIGFINTFTYKNLTLRSQIDWRQGGDIQSISIGSLLGRGVTRDTEDRERTHIIPGFYGDVNGNYTLDASGNRIPNTTQIDTNDLYFTGGGPSNTWGINSTDQGTVYDGTVYRLRELSLTYDVPSKWLEKTPFGKASFSAVGNNLWYFAPNVPRYTNYDPEVTSFGSGRVQGIENSSAPTSKRYGFKINLTF